MLMLLFYARWHFPTLRLKHKNLKESSNRDVNMYKIQNKSYTYWLYTFKKHVGDYSQWYTICSVRIPLYMRWGSEHSGGCLFGLALCPDDIISREMELRTSVKYEEVELGKYFSPHVSSWAHSDRSNQHCSQTTSFLHSWVLASICSGPTLGIRV